MYTQHRGCRFSHGYLPVKMASKTVITEMIRFRALFPISALFRLSPPPPPLNVFLVITGYVSTDRGSSSFNCSQTSGNATLQKQGSYVHVSA